MNNNEELNQAPDIVVVDESDEGTNTMSWVLNLPLPVGTRLYTAPPGRNWIGLTDEEEIELDETYGDDFNAYIDARDAKLKEKNHD